MNDSKAREILNSLPGGFIPELLRVIAHAYQAAFTRTRDFPNHARQSVMPIVRRGLIERDVPVLAGKHTLSASAFPNSVGNYMHVRVRCERLFFTVSGVRSPEDLVRPARFRGNYAKSAQPDLFDSAGVPHTSDALAYGVLTHGPERRDKRVMAFAHMSFPNEDFSEYLAQVDLIRLCHEAGEQLYGLSEEPQRMPTIKLRPNAKRQVS